MQISNLYECWRNVLSADKSQLQTPTSYISRVAGIQIALVAKQGIADCEIQILSELNRLIQTSKRPPKESPRFILQAGGEGVAVAVAVAVTIAFGTPIHIWIHNPSILVISASCTKLLLLLFLLTSFLSPRLCRTA